MIEEERAWYPDSDGDGLNDAFEKAESGSDPEVADTDNDGADDRAEYLNETDPHNADSDGDGLSDGEEINTYETDPTKADSDADGIDDFNSVLLRVLFNNDNLPTAAALLTNYYAEQTATFATGEALDAALALLVEDGWLDGDNAKELSVYARKGTSLKTAAGDALKDAADKTITQIKNNNYDNVIVFRVDLESRLVYAIEKEHNLLMVFKFTNDEGLNLQSVLKLDELFTDVQNIAVASDDHANLIVLANWDEATGTAKGNLVVLAAQGLTGETVKVYSINGSEGCERFAVSPDGSKIAFLKDGEISVADMLADPEEELWSTTFDGAMAAFARDGRLITAMNNGVATLCDVKVQEGDQTFVEEAFYGIFHTKQPTIDQVAVVVTLTVEQNVLRDEAATVELTTTSYVTPNKAVELLGYNLVAVDENGEDASDWSSISGLLN